MTNEFWQFSITTYAHERAARAFLEMQDDRGLDVNVLLYACWLASKNRQLTAHHLEALECCIAQWQRRVVMPLRDLRRELKSYADASLFRDEIKGLELRAERQQQNLMWEFFRSADTLPTIPTPLEDNLNLVCGASELDSAVLNYLKSLIST